MNQNVQIQQLLDIYNVYPTMKFDAAARYLDPDITKAEISLLLHKILKEELLRLIDKATSTCQITKFGRMVIDYGGWVSYDNMRRRQNTQVWEKVWPARVQQ
jgi:hypothetical protein